MQGLDKLADGLTMPTTKAMGVIAQLQHIRELMDKNEDGKIDAHEFMLGLSHYPKIIALIFSLLTSVYLIVKVILGFLEGFDTISIIVSICIIIAMVVVYLTMKQSNKSQIDTIKNIQERNKIVIDAANRTINELEERMNALDTENTAYRVQNGLYKFVVETFQKSYPDAKIPNPALPDYDSLPKKPVVMSNDGITSTNTPPV